MSEFVLLYRSSPEAHRESMGSPARARQPMAKWRAGLTGLTEKEQLKNLGQPLERAGRVVGGNKKMVTDGPYAETKDIIGGYSVVEAKDLDEAAEIASGCPVLHFGGCVEV